MDSRHERRHTWDLNLLLGAWLFISAFVWPHTFDETLTTAICGALILGASGGGLIAPDLRHVEAAVGVLLIVASLVIPHASVATLYNGVIVGGLVFALSFVRVDDAGHRLGHHAHR